MLVSILESLTIIGLELEGNVLLLGLHELLVGGGHPLGVVLVVDGVLAPVDLVLSDGLDPGVILGEFLVDVLGEAGPDHLDGAAPDDEDGDADPEFVLDHPDLLGQEEGGQAAHEHVGAGDAGLRVEELEELFRNPVVADIGPVDRPGSSGEVDEITL